MSGKSTLTFHIPPSYGARKRERGERREERGREGRSRGRGKERWETKRNC